MPLKPAKLLDGQVAFPWLDGRTDRPEAGVGRAVVFGAHEELEVVDGEVVFSSVHGDDDQGDVQSRTAPAPGHQHCQWPDQASKTTVRRPAGISSNPLIPPAPGWPLPRAGRGRPGRSPCCPPARGSGRC
jgi:hypothetical protein